MELRPIQSALLAGRSASRRATTASSPLSYASIPSFYRCFSSTRPSLSEAEATAPAPPPSMQEWHQQQQQQQKQPEQPQRRTWGTPSSSNNSNTSLGLASLLGANRSTRLPSTSTPDPSGDSRRTPWASPSSAGLRRSQANRLAANGASKPGIIDTLADMGLPTSEDLSRVAGLSQESASDIKYRLRPSVGRTVHIDGTRVDLARALGLLNTRVRVNKIAQDVAKQRFHERPGLKRKRLRSERWRARFKDGFKANCSRVQNLARQGW